MKYKPVIIYGILLLVFIIATLPWTQMGVPGTDDFRHHATRLWIMQQEVQNFHFSEWSFTAYGGWPLFHFYHPMFYILTLPIAAMFNAIVALKVSTVLIYAICLFGTLFASKKLFDDDDIALIVSIAYFLSATFLTQATVAGALPRLLAMALTPCTIIIFILSLREKKYTIPAILLLAILFMTHLSVAIPVFILCAIYLAYEIYIQKQILWKGIVILLIPILLSSAWFIPLLMEKSYSNFGMATGDIGVPAISSIFTRSFGKTSSHYFGYATLILALLGLMFVKGANIYKVGLVASIALYYNIFGFLNFIPLMNTALTSSSGYFISVLIFNAVILATLCVSSFAQQYKKWLIYIALAIIIIELYPGLNAFSYGWVSQPTANFYNPPELIDAWKWISYQPGEFVVFSAIGYSAEIYHGKQEFGGDWVGCPQCVSKVTYDTHNEIYQNFMKGYKDDAQLGLFGTKFYVVPCQSVLNNTLAYTNKAVCVYENEKFMPLIQSDPNVQIINENWKSDSIEFTTISDNQAGVVVKVNYFKPHWHAYVNGKEVVIEKVEPEFMGIVVPSGENKVLIIYKTNMLHIISWIITFLTLCGIVYFLKK